MVIKRAPNRTTTHITVVLAFFLLPACRLQNIYKYGYDIDFKYAKGTPVQVDITSLHSLSPYASCLALRGAASVCKNWGFGARTAGWVSKTTLYGQRLTLTAECYGVPAAILVEGYHMPTCSRVLTGKLTPRENIEYTQSLSPRKSMRLSLSRACDEGLSQCRDEIAHRTVQVTSREKLGTGFIIQANETEMVVLTAAHVVRQGTSGQGAISDRLKVFDPFLRSENPVRTACAYFGGNTDAAILFLENPRKFEYPQVVTDLAAEAGDPVVVTSNRHERQEQWQYRIRGFDNEQKEVILVGEANHGDSGSAIISYRGGLVGVLDSTGWNPPIILNFGDDEDQLWMPVTAGESQVHGTIAMTGIIAPRQTLLEHANSRDFACREF